MKNKIDLSKSYWFYISSDVYISYSKNDTTVLLYHTKTGEYLETDNTLLIQMVKEIYIPKNLGVIKIDCITNVELASILEVIIEKELGCIKEIEENSAKPINLLPILNLTKDIDKLTKDNDIPSILNGTLKYLSELNIYINEECKEDCIFCSDYYKQIKTCYSKNTRHELKPDILIEVLKQIEYSMVKKINILGGNLFLYSHIDKLTEVLNEFDFEFHLWINYLQLPKEDIALFKQKNIFKVFVFNFPFCENSIQSVLDRYKNSKRTQFCFIIENETHYSIVAELIDKYNLDNTIITPLYTKENISFFEDNVYLNKEDLFYNTLSMREIFRNQKLNLNNFGSLTILANGTVKANINAPDLGNIYDNSILELIHNELTINTAWRKIRNKGVCSNCLYQYLCPPPSNYETAIGELNLCHIQIS